jgi:hypothetical protein
MAEAVSVFLNKLELCGPIVETITERCCHCGVKQPGQSLVH